MTNKEKVEILLKYFGTNLGNIDLSDIDFGDRDVFNNGQKAKFIHNTFQQAEVINNNYQEATKIYNDNQVIKPKYEDMSKEQLIARIKELENE